MSPPVDKMQLNAPCCALHVIRTSSSALLNVPPVGKCKVPSSVTEQYNKML